ncbi:MAG TPA: hypothetical protein VHL09_05945 [Dehalococcoidia bacterium]|nr:hypothetical protein [Dehalococcoidia bacterium]
MKGRFLAEAGTYRLEVVEPIPWPRGGLTEAPLPYRAGGLAAPDGPRPLSPGERALIDRLIGYVDELITSCGGQTLHVDVSLNAAPPKHAEVRVAAALAPRPRSFPDFARLARRVDGLCCAPVIAYREADLLWYQCANCARLFCPECLAPDLVSQQVEPEEDEELVEGWSLRCAACSYLV